MSLNPQTKPARCDDDTVTRKPYVAPQLEVYGAVQELTHTTISFTFVPDGGTGPAMYTSGPV